MVGGIIMNKIINKLASIILRYGEQSYDTEYKHIKRDIWGSWVSPDKLND
jgi:hypothetical protein